MTTPTMAYSASAPHLLPWSSEQPAVKPFGASFRDPYYEADVPASPTPTPLRSTGLSQWRQRRNKTPADSAGSPAEDEYAFPSMDTYSMDLTNGISMMSGAGSTQDGNSRTTSPTSSPTGCGLAFVGKPSRSGSKESKASKQSKGSKNSGFSSSSDSDSSSSSSFSKDSDDDDDDDDGPAVETRVDLHPSLLAQMGAQASSETKSGSPEAQQPAKKSTAEQPSAAAPAPEQKPAPGPRRMSLPTRLDRALNNNSVDGAAVQDPALLAILNCRRRSSMRLQGTMPMQRRRSTAPFEDTLAGLPPAKRFRATLVNKFGSLRKAYKMLDKDGRGLLHYHDMRESVREQGLEKEVEKTGCKTIRNLWKEFDTVGKGVLTLSEFMGDGIDPPPDENEEWQYLTTAEKWTRWCERTTTEGQSKQRQAVWQSRPDLAVAAIKELEARRSKTLHRMRTMMAQGQHKTAKGLRTTAPHLLDISDNDTVAHYRREALETVELSSKRIRHALQESARSRHDLESCVRALRDVGEEARRNEKRDLFRRQKLERERQLSANNAGRRGVGAIMTLHALDLLCEAKEALKEDEEAEEEESS